MFRGVLMNTTRWRSFSTSTRSQSLLPSLRVCVVGSGVGGLSTAHHLIKLNSHAVVDVMDKLPVPFGLIRYGVAPDHAEVKNCVNHLSRIAELPNCHFIGNVSLGSHISLRQLQALYDAVVLAYGAQEDCKLRIPGEDLPGVHSARSFYSWYNGLPTHKELGPDLSGEVAVVIGQGNVALDVARILLTPTQLLENTDICEHAHRALQNSQLKQVYLVGRQGPLQVSFSAKELRSMAQLPGCRFHFDSSDMEQIRNLLPDLPRPKKRLAQLMIDTVHSGHDRRGVNLKEWKMCFRRTPVQLLADGASGRVAAVRLEVNKLEGDWRLGKYVGTGQYEELPCSMVLRSIGYRTPHVEGVPFDATTRAIPNERGRVTQGKNGEIIPGLYCSGWVKTGPVGAVLNTMSSAYETAETITEDNRKGKLKKPTTTSDSSTPPVLHQLGQATFPTSFSDWKLIDRLEQLAGTNQGLCQKKPREKIVSFEEMIKVIRENGGGWLRAL